ncbi:peptidoglycan-associated lipoprotein Pal [Parasedimentitalea maritima]|uniref:Peptidoglycan-associated lipoprotein n=2 Tax=Parasedimentitalea TaxID=2738399 RepID=A0A6L6WMB0_9RHOB|nr:MULTISPECIES: peptidoglycan-associated lipoprotein Pal [Zongyanglinia]KAE9627350.1 peptidoglycan-associated lipoprotein Pal [Zongyanglinia marina]MVO16782.1 peptidoglycan-associated lipoprotein Pal [Zongyanglinia huanghaiensis]TLP58399.1 peptidoglycan-associated lipoprotein Pal [Zongyanglinia marina]
MSGLTKAILVISALGLSACTNAAWDNSNTTDLNSGGAAGVADQTSPAYFQQEIGDRVLFVVNESGLTTEAQGILLAQANWLLANTDYNATIEGHADEQGTREYNLALGARRANSAREYLVSRGVAGSRIKVLTYGKERPLEICSDESCYSKNRRAVTILAGGLTG